MEIFFSSFSLDCEGVEMVEWFHKKIILDKLYYFESTFEIDCIHQRRAIIQINTDPRA